MIQEGLDFCKKISKRKIFLNLTLTYVHMGCQKVPKWLSKSIFYVKNHSNLSDFFSLKNISLEEGFLLVSFFENLNFWTDLFSKMAPNFLRSMWTSVKVKSKNHFHLLIFLLKSTPFWLTSAKLNHLGHINTHVAWPKRAHESAN